MPDTAITIGEMVLKTTIREPTSIVNMVLDLAVSKGARKGIGAVIVLEGALGMNGGGEGEELRQNRNKQNKASVIHRCGRAIGEFGENSLKMSNEKGRKLCK